MKSLPKFGSVVKFSNLSHIFQNILDSLYGVGEHRFGHANIGVRDVGFGDR